MITNNISIKSKIKEYFFMFPNSKLRVREIERKLKIPLPSVIRYCKELNNEDILTTIKTGEVVFYTAQRSNDKFLIEKRLNNIRTLYDSGLVNFIKEKLNNPKIIVFGSFSKGEDSEQSDIDLYVETPSKKEIDIKEFENKLSRKLQILKHNKISDIKNIHLINNIINGITLNGFVEVL